MTTGPSKQSSPSNSVLGAHKKKTKIKKKKKKVSCCDQLPKPNKVQLDITNALKNTPQTEAGVDFPRYTENESKTVLKKKKLKKNKNVNKPSANAADPSSDHGVGAKISKELPRDLDLSCEPKSKAKKSKKKKAKRDDSAFATTQSQPVENSKDNIKSVTSQAPESTFKTNKKLKRKRKTSERVVLEKSCDTVNNGIVKKISESIETIVCDNNCEIDKRKKSKKKKKQCSDNISELNRNTDPSPEKDKNIKGTPLKISEIKLKDNCDEGDNNEVFAEKKKRKKKKKKRETEDHEDITRNGAQDDAQGLKTKKRKRLKRKLSATDDQQEGDKVSKEGSMKMEEPNLGQWQTAKLATTAQQNKFIRLLGGAKEKVVEDTSKNNNKGSVLSRLSGVWKPPQGRTLWGSLQNSRPKTFSTMALDKNESEKLSSNLESQYNETLAFNLQKRKEGNAAKGLGFQEDPAKGKKHHIDIHKVKSIALD